MKKLYTATTLQNIPSVDTLTAELAEAYGWKRPETLLKLKDYAQQECSNLQDECYKIAERTFCCACCGKSVLHYKRWPAICRTCSKDKWFKYLMR